MRIILFLFILLRGCNLTPLAWSEDMPAVNSEDNDVTLGCETRIKTEYFDEPFQADQQNEAAQFAYIHKGTVYLADSKNGQKWFLVHYPFDVVVCK